MKSKLNSNLTNRLNYSPKNLGSDTESISSFLFPCTCPIRSCVNYGKNVFEYRKSYFFKKAWLNVRMNVLVFRMKWSKVSIQEKSMPMLLLFIHSYLWWSFFLTASALPHVKGVTRLIPSSPSIESRQLKRLWALSPAVSVAKTSPTGSQVRIQGCQTHSHQLMGQSGLP